MNEADTFEFLSRLTSEPGIYRMFGEDDVVLYVGKASNLKKRVSSYFTRALTGSKTRSLVSQITRVEVTVTRSETEALLLESNLIKSLRPKYNVLLRDDKSYPFISLSSKHAYPRLAAIRLHKKPTEGQFFGPYPSVSAIRETLTVIQKLFKIRNCTDSYFNARLRPCLQYQIKRCSAPCVGFISPEHYQQAVKQAVAFLQGKRTEIIDALALQMEDAVKRLAFEEASICRDQIKSLRLIQEQQGISRLQGDADVLVIDAKPGFACVQCVMVREGQILDHQAFFPTVPRRSLEDESDEQLWEQVFTAFVAFYYVDHPERVPSLIVTNRSLVDHSLLESLLATYRGTACKIQTKPRGVKARWVDFALDNLQRAVTERMSTVTLMKTRYEALQAFLRVESPISRMVCFDISHTQGQETVASCVVFDMNGPLKRDYRRFNINGITPGDDYAAMEQVIMRYFKPLAGGKALPDVLIIDGGKGQVSMARAVLESLKIQGVTLLGIAKGPDRKPGWERLIVGEGAETVLPKDSPALHLLQYIRDESHRFAITAHRKKRQKTSLSSSLETIEGVGSRRRQALLSRFGGFRELAKASLEEIAKVPGISMTLAKRIYQHFR